MKKSLLFALMAILGGVTLLGAGCGDISDNRAIEGEESLRIATSIFPVYDLASTVAGEEVEVVLIAPPGASPHYFEPTPSLLKELSDVDIVFRIGAELDDWVESITDNIDDVEVVALDQYVNLHLSQDDEHGHEEGHHEDEEHEEESHEDHHGHDEEADEHHEDHDEEHGDEHDHDDEHEHDHGMFDPHYWLDPTNAEQMVTAIAEELAHHDEENREDYLERADDFVAELETRDREWQTTLTALPTKDLVTFHDAFGYFADHFGLSIVATFEPFPGKEPTAKYLANLQEEINEHQITDLFLEPQLSAAAITSFAADNNIDLGVLDPIGGVEDRGSYLSLIDFNVKQLVKYLGN